MFASTCAMYGLDTIGCSLLTDWLELPATGTELPVTCGALLEPLAALVVG